MITSYQFSNRFDPISILTGAVGALFALLRVLAIVLGLAVGLAAVFAVVVSFWLPLCQVCGALAAFDDMTDADQVDQLAQMWGQL